MPEDIVTTPEPTSKAVEPQVTEGTPKEAPKETSPNPEPAKEQPKPEHKEPEKEGTQEGGSPEGKTEVVEKYDLKMPDGAVLDESYLKTVEAYAKDLGLTQDQAQKLLERDAAMASESAQKQQEAHQAKITAWEDELKADKEFGGDAWNESSAHAQRALQRFAPPELIEDLSKTGMGNYPPLAKFIRRVGAAFADDRMVLPGNQHGSKEVSFAEALYGSKEQ